MKRLFGLIGIYICSGFMRFISSAHALPLLRVFTLTVQMYSQQSASAAVFAAGKVTTP